MTAEERIAELETELARERAKSAQLEAENTQLRQQMEQVLARLSEVEGRLAKDSHNWLSENDLTITRAHHVTRSHIMDFSRSYGGFWDFFLGYRGIYHGRNEHFREVHAHSILQLRWKSQLSLSFSAYSPPMAPESEKRFAGTTRSPQRAACLVSKPYALCTPFV
jgi:hypothetical protein